MLIVVSLVGLLVKYYIKNHWYPYVFILEMLWCKNYMFETCSYMKTGSNNAKHV
jgi:hypothetical protein